MIKEWLDTNPLDEYLLPELTHLETEQTARLDRKLKEAEYVTQVAKIVDNVKAGKIPKWMKVFPYRPSRGIWRWDTAPIMARREGDYIIVQQPLLEVAYTDRFKKDVNTLPRSVFSQGLKLRPNEIIGVREYDNDEKVVVCYATDLLDFSKRSDNAVFLNIALTAVDVVASPAIGRVIGRGVGFLGSRVLSGGSRMLNYLGRKALAPAMSGLLESAPTAFGQVASRTGFELVEMRSTSQIARSAISHSAESAARPAIEGYNEYCRISSPTSY